MTVEFNEQEYSEFSELVRDLSSHDQVTRISARVNMPAFVERVGKEKCDAMFVQICAEND